MTNSSFYGDLLPDSGLRCLAVFKNGLGAPPIHEFYDNNEDFLAAAAAWDSLGKNVYHACATYKTPDNRKGENAHAAKALWVDMDVGPTKPHATKQEAAASILQFAVDVGLPKPHLVTSGSGVHAYFIFEKAISADKWQVLAQLNAACLNHAGVKHDTSRTQDIASILRIPGTNNYKTDPPLPVKRLPVGEVVPVRQIYEALKKYFDDNHLTLAPAKPSKTPANDLIGNQDYPPSVGELVSEKCPTIKDVADTGGDTGYEVWWRAIGVAKHTTEPEVVAAFWTRNREATGHSKYDWQRLMEDWPTGPTTCDNFSQHSTKCASCQYFGKITSPIQLGVPEAPVVDTASLKRPEPLKPLAESDTPPMPGPWEYMADWVVDQVTKGTRTGINGGKMTMSLQNEDGTYTHKPFCSTYWQAMRRVRNLEGNWLLEIAYTEYDGKPPRTFLFDSASVLVADAFRKAFSSRELHILQGQNGLKKAQEVLMFEQDLLRIYRQETVTHGAMGWVTEGNKPRGALTGEFVLGNTMFAPGKKPVEVLLDEKVSDQFRHGYTASGTAEAWVSMVDRIYNRPNAQAYQFVIAAMFAAPLVRLVPAQGQWHGIPIALIGDSGAAKTTTARVALSMYGPPDTAQFASNSGKDGQGDTINAFATKIGTMQNLPFVADEMTSVAPEQLSALMYMLTQGQRKDRSNPDGSLVPNPMRWDTISIATANESFHEKLRLLENENTKDATQLRCFEVKLHESDLRDIFHDVSKSDIEDDLLAQNYGAVGREWIQFIVDNRAKIAERLGERRRTFKIDDDDTSRHRFYLDLIMTVSVAAEFAKKAGLLTFDVQALTDWAGEHTKGLREDIKFKDWDSAISDFVASLHGRTIVTRRYSIGRGRRATEELQATIGTGVVPVARKATEDRKFFVTVSALSEWAKKNRTTPVALMNQMRDRGYIVSQLDDHPKVNIGSGSPIPRPSAPCVELDYDLVVGEVEEGGAADNVVNFPLPEDMPPPAAGDQLDAAADA